MYLNSSSQHRIRYVLSSLILIALTSGLPQARAQDRFAAVQVEAQPVNKNIYMLTGAGGNIGVSVGVDGTLIIDDQYGPLGEKILAALERLGGSRPKIILNTHFHGDHTGSNPLMGSTGTIIAHDNVRARLVAMEEFPRAGLPLVTYEEQLKVHFNDDELTLLHLPGGHTIETSSSAIRDALQADVDPADIAAQIDQQYPGWGSGFISAERWVDIVQADLAATQ